MHAPLATRLPDFRRPRPRPSWGGRLLDGWLLQHYALAVWLTTGVRKRHPPHPFSQLTPGINTLISGQLGALFNSLLLLLTGRSLPDGAFYLLNGLLLLWLLVSILPWLEKRALSQSIPARFRKLSEGQRRRWAWAGFLLFWTAFNSIFVVGFTLD